jgi:hypothetical protein
LARHEELFGWSELWLSLLVHSTVKGRPEKRRRRRRKRRNIFETEVVAVVD